MDFVTAVDGDRQRGEMLDRRGARERPDVHGAKAR
jgi:hypothetical protein